MLSAGDPRRQHQADSRLPGAAHAASASAAALGKLRYQRKCTKTRPKFLESFSTRW